MKLITLALLLMIIISITSCHKKAEEVLRIGIISPSINHLPLSFTMDKVAQDNTKIQMQYFSSGWEAQEALIAGKTDAAIMPFSYAWNAAAKGYPVKIVSFLERETDGIVAKASLKDISALNGKKIGLLKASTVELLLLDLATTEKLSYDPIYFRTPNEMVAALTADEVDAIVAYVPVIQTIPEGYEVLHWFGDSHHNHPCCDLVVNEKQLDSHKTSVLKKMITQIEGVLPNVNTENPELMQYIADKYGLTPSQATEAMQHTHFATGLEVAGKKLERKLTDISVTKGYQPRQLRDNEIYLELK